MLEVVILSAIQGITEFLPISSSSHLILISIFLNFDFENLTLDISLHIGSLLAIIFYFKKEIFNFAKNKKLFFLIALGSIPTIIFGFIVVKNNFIDILRNIQIIGWATLVLGMILYLSDLKRERKKIDKLSLSSALFIGCFQILSLIPGVSRSGITITAARFLEFERTEAAKISFLLSIPTLIAVSFYGIYGLIMNDSLIITIQNYSGMILSFLFSLITIKYFISFLKKFSLLFFVSYRIILGLVILIYVYG